MVPCSLMSFRAIQRAIQVCWAAIAVGVALASPGPVSVNAAPATLIPNGKAAAAHQVVLSGVAVQGPMAEAMSTGSVFCGPEGARFHRNCNAAFEHTESFLRDCGCPYPCRRS